MRRTVAYYFLAQLETYRHYFNSAHDIFLLNDKVRCIATVIHLLMITAFSLFEVGGEGKVNFKIAFILFKLVVMTDYHIVLERDR